MNKTMVLPADWYYDEMQQVGVDYEDYAEVQNYDLRMNKIRCIDKETEGVNILLCKRFDPENFVDTITGSYSPGG